MTFCFTFPLCFPNLLYDIVLMELAVGALAVGVPSSSSWFGCSGHPLLPVLLWLSITLPKPCITVKTHGKIACHLAFGFNPRTNDYKVVRIVFPYRTEKSKPPVIDIYSLNEGSWRIISALFSAGFWFFWMVVTGSFFKWGCPFCGIWYDQTQWSISLVIWFGWWGFSLDIIAKWCI